VAHHFQRALSHELRCTRRHFSKAPQCHVDSDCSCERRPSSLDLSEVCCYERTTPCPRPASSVRITESSAKFDSLLYAAIRISHSPALYHSSINSERVHVTRHASFIGSRLRVSRWKSWRSSGPERRFADHPPLREAARTRISATCSHYFRGRKIVSVHLQILSSLMDNH
jgi:hypothetical protein